jgi:hypothetical protein
MNEYGNGNEHGNGNEPLHNIDPPSTNRFKAFLKSGSITKAIPTLNFAAINNRMDIAKSLLEDGANVNEKNRVGNTPLHLAIINDSPDMVSLLLEYGANVNEKNNSGNTPLHLAKGKGAEIAKLLLEKGADINSTNSNGRTPLDENPGLAELNRKVQNFEVRKPLLQLAEGLGRIPRDHSRYQDEKATKRYLQDELVARDIASYLDNETKGGKYKRKYRKSRKSRKTRKSRKSRKSRRH